MREPLAITGLGAVSALGAGVPALAEGLSAGRSGIGPVRGFDASPFRARMAAEVPADVRLPEAESRCEAFALQAAAEAWSSAGLGPGGPAPVRTAVLIGTSAGGMQGVEDFRHAELAGDPEPDLSVLRPCVLGHLGDRVARELGLGGPRFGISTACSSSAVSIAVAADLLLDHRVDLALAGGAEAMSEFIFAGFHSLSALDPETCRPFDANRQGLVLGEGAAAVVLERLETARAAGREPLALLAGYGLTCDSSHLTAPEETGAEVARTMRAALEDAGLPPDAIDHVDAHGTGTPRGDTAEIRGIGMLSDGGPTVSALKSMLGHTLGAAGALGLVASVMMLRSGAVFPTANLDQVDPLCGANHVMGSAQPAAVDVIASNSFSFGGNNVTLILRSADG